MRCPEERSPAWRRLFFTLFVTQVSCPAHPECSQATPTRSLFSVCYASLSLCCVVVLLLNCMFCASSVSTCRSVNLLNFVSASIFCHLFLSHLFAACAICNGEMYVFYVIYEMYVASSAFH